MRQPEDESLCSVPTWTLHARQFVATGNPRCLLKAAQSCMDRRIRKFIEQCQEDSLSYKNCQRFVADLRTERRDDEATMIELLFLREGALEADTIDAAHEDESVAEDVCRYLVDVSHNSGFVECEALFCATLGRRYATLKEWRRAQALLWHAAELYKGLVASGAEIYRPFGARTLIIWANVLLQMREYSKAAAEGAVQFFRTLERSEHELASALNTYGNVLCEQHEFQASERALNEALSLYRGLNLENPGAFAADIGVVLNNLGNVLAEMLDLAGARRAYEEAVDVQRELANTDRDIFRPELARTLGNLGNLLARARDFGSSLLAHEESIKIYQQLREARPRLYDPDTATGLTNFGRVLMAERKFEGARHAFDQARDIFQELARAERDIYSRDVALSLHNLALVAAEEGDLDAARRLYTQSLRIFLELAEKDLKAYQPHVADTLQSLGDVLFNGGHLPEAKEAFDQTLRIRRELTKANDAYMTDVQATLNRLGVLLTECGDFNDAETMFDEALRIGRKLAIDAPHMFGPTVARTLSDYMAMLDKTPADVHVIDLCLEAIHWAESCSSDEARLWLAKGEAFRAYQRFLGHLAAGNSPDATFRCLTALREGRVQALGDHPEQGLSAAAASVADLSAHVGRKCNILIAQELTDSQTLLGILSSNEQAPLYICQVRGLATAARSLFSGIIRGFFADDQRNAQSSRQEAVVHARNIWALFPERVRQVLHPSCSDDVHISGDAFWAVFPWELLHYGEDEDDWLGLQRPLARWSPITAGSISRLRATTFGDGSLSATVFSPWDVNDDRLTGSREEASNISHRLASELGYELVPGNVPYLSR
jgi:tetratricopeptide (TPR) repeat protein